MTECSRERAKRTGICMDGIKCGDTNWYCADCPHRDWIEGEKRMNIIGHNGPDAKPYDRTESEGAGD